MLLPNETLKVGPTYVVHPWRPGQPLKTEVLYTRTPNPLAVSPTYALNPSRNPRQPWKPPA